MNEILQNNDGNEEKEQEFIEERLNLSELNMYVNLLESDRGVYKNNDGYKQLIIDLKKELNLNVSVDDLDRLYNPIIYESEMDAYFKIRNIWGI